MMLINIVKFAKIHSRQLSAQLEKGLFFRYRVFLDMIYCYLKYKMFTNQYLNQNFHSLNSTERKIFGKKNREDGKRRICWYEETEKDRNLFGKYGSIKYEKSRFRSKRNKAYSKRYNTGDNLFVGYGVNISRQHFLEGSITIGNNVCINRNNWIDYSGGLIIEDGVSISNGVIIETHSHPAFSDPTKSYVEAIPTPLMIEKGAIIGSNVIILESCNKIGRCARIGAGSVCAKNVPPYSIVMGNPAKVISFIMTPEEIVEFEIKNYPVEKRLSKEYLNRNFDKYYINRIKEIKDFLK